MPKIITLGLHITSGWKAADMSAQTVMSHH